MRVIRKPAVAGLFYPDDPDTLQHSVEHYLKHQTKSQGQSPKAIISPHAGYIYSGETAAKAFSCLTSAKDRIKRVVLLGPSHRVGFEGIAFCSADIFETPLGDIPVDHSAFSAISHLPGVLLLDQAHAQEHSLEVQLPFLQSVLSDFSLVPLVIGDTDRRLVANVLERLWGGDDTLIVISSDLSHYHDYATAKLIDENTCSAIENLQPDKIGYDQACGRTPVNGLLELAKKRKLTVSTLGLCNSGDTAGDKQRVVGYGAWAFYEGAA